MLGTTSIMVDPKNWELLEEWCVRNGISRAETVRTATEILLGIVNTSSEGNINVYKTLLRVLKEYEKDFVSRAPIRTSAKDM